MPNSSINPKGRRAAGAAARGRPALPALAAALALLLSGCGEQEGAGGRGITRSEDLGKPVVMIGKTSFSKEAFLDYLSSNRIEDSGYGEPSAGDGSVAAVSEEEVFSSDNVIEDTATRPQMLSRLLDMFIIEEILLRRAVSLGIDPGDSEVSAYLLGIGIDRTKLDGDGLERLEDTTRRSLAIRRFLETEVLKGIEVKEAAILEFYQSHLDDFSLRPRFRFRWLHITGEPEAERIVRALRREGLTFEQVSEEYEVPIEGGGQGAEGFWELEEIPDRFSSALSRLAPGSISDAIEDPYGGYNIFEMQEVQPGRQLALQEVRHLIAYRLREAKSREVYQAYITNLKRENPVTIYHDNLGFTYAPGG